jgi:hypothetical protein
MPSCKERLNQAQPIENPRFSGARGDKKRRRRLAGFSPGEREISTAWEKFF